MRGGKSGPLGLINYAVPASALAAQLMDASIGWESVSNYLDDRREAVAAFREKRAPNLTGE